MEQLLAGLLLWITQNSSFEYEKEMGFPQVQQVTQMQLAKLYLGDDKAENKASFRQRAQGYLSEAHKKDLYEDLAKNLEAVYDSERNIIYLGKKVDVTSDYGHSVLVHELIHFLQKKHNQHALVECHNALEKDAYFIQEDFMKQHQLTPPFNRFTVLMRSMCADSF